MRYLNPRGASVNYHFHRPPLKPRVACMCGSPCHRLCRNSLSSELLSTCKPILCFLPWAGWRNVEKRRKDNNYCKMTLLSWLLTVYQLIHSFKHLLLLLVFY